MKIKDKKAQMRKSLVGIIIAIITAAIILLFMSPFSSIFSETADAETCRTSVNLRAGIIEQGFLSEAAIKLPPLKCQTEYKCISKDGDCENSYEKIKVKDENEIKKEISGMMYGCWDMLGKGEKSFIGSWENGLLKNDKVCVICSTIDFDSSIKSQKEIYGLGRYMYETRIPGKNFTYLQFISNNNNPEFVSDSDDKILTEKKQSIIFIIGKTTTIKSALTGVISGTVGGALIGSVIPLVGSATIGGIGAIVGGVGGLITGVGYKSEYSTSLLLVPHESITEYCKDLKSAV